MLKHESPGNDSPCLNISKAAVVYCVCVCVACGCDTIRSRAASATQGDRYGVMMVVVNDVNVMKSVVLSQLRLSSC